MKCPSSSTILVDLKDWLKENYDPHHPSPIFFHQEPTISDTYREFKGILGKPLGNEQPVYRGTTMGKYQQFEYGNIYWTESYGAREVHGEILKKYQKLGETKILGFPLCNVGYLCKNGNLERYFSDFEDGTIIWDPNTTQEALAVYGMVFKKYLELNTNNGFRPGYPITDTMSLPGNDGQWCQFENGTIYYHPGCEAHIIHGPILKKYYSLGPSPAIGYPTSDVILEKDGGMRCEFENGTIYYKLRLGPDGNPIVAAYVVQKGPFLSKYQSYNGCQGEFGYPTNDAMPEPGGQGVRQTFEHGAIYFYAGVAFEVIGEIWIKYDLMGGSTGPLGRPLSGINKVGTWIYNQFANGRIYWNSINTEAYEVHGDIYKFWIKNTLVGMPLSDQFQFDKVDSLTGKKTPYIRNVFELGAIDQSINPLSSPGVVSHHTQLSTNGIGIKFAPTSVSIFLYSFINTGTKVIDGTCSIFVIINQKTYLNTMTKLKLAPGETMDIWLPGTIFSIYPQTPSYFDCLYQYQLSGITILSNYQQKQNFSQGEWFRLEITTYNNGYDSKSYKGKA